MINIDKGVSIILHDWLNVKKDELIHFITDETHLREAEAISRWAYGADAVLKTTLCQIYSCHIFAVLSCCFLFLMQR